MDIRIGILNTGRELSFESTQTAAEVEKTVAAALDAKASHFTLADSKGSVFVVPIASFGYLEIGTDQTRRVGFVA